MSRPLRVALVAGEASGDILGAGLMQALKQQHPQIEFIGVGGPRMEAEGLVSAFPMERLAVMGLVEVLGRLRELLARRKRLIRELVAARPDVFIGIDAPDFNLTLELKLRQAGIKTVHYVSPSVWAWRQKRVLKIRDACDLMLTLFPFEARFYLEHQVPVRFVGHPLANTIPLQADRVGAREALGLAPDEPVVALLPGSRGGEVARLGALFLDAAERLRTLRPGIRFVLPCANAERRAQLEAMLAGRNLPLLLLDGRSHEALAACDAVLIASGTATLEALLHKRPIGQRRHLVGHHHRPFVQQGFQGGGARGDQHRVAGGQRLMGAAIEQQQRQVAPGQHGLQLCAALGIGTGQHEADTRAQRAQALGGIEEQRAEARHFATPTTRQQGHHQLIRRQTERLAGADAVRLQRYGVGQWVTDEAHRHLMLQVETRLEGEQGQHQVAGITNLQHALVPPGPQPRGYVVHGLDAGLAQLEFEGQVEIRSIDTDEHVRPGRDQLPDQALCATPVARADAPAPRPGPSPPGAPWGTRIQAPRPPCADRQRR